MAQTDSQSVRCAPFPRKVVATIGLAVLVWGASPADLAAAAVTISQITHGGGFEPSISGDGNTIVFDGNLDPVGENPGGAQQIFAYDVAQQSFTQITHTTSANVFPFAPVADFHASKIAYFVDKPTKNGSKDPIYLFDRATQTVVKVAANARTNAGIAISGNGSRIYFISNADLIPGSNPGKNDELFRYRTTTQSLRQMTNTTPPFGGLTMYDPSVSRDGKRLVVASVDDLGGNGPSDAGEVFFATFPLTGSHLQQISTEAGGFSDEATISADGLWITFRSDDDLITGQNTDHNEEIFLFSLATNTLTQVTNTKPTDIAGSVLPVVNGDGSRILFASTANLDPSVGNLDHNFDFFVYDKGTSKFTQITNTVVPTDSNLSQGNPSFSDDGTRIVFVSEADLVAGQNTAHNFEVFLATLP